jgi:hypothetical protein
MFLTHITRNRLLILFAVLAVLLVLALVMSLTSFAHFGPNKAMITFTAMNS